MAKEKFIKLHFAETNVPRWINVRHVVWFSPPTSNSQAGCDIFVIGDDAMAETEYLGVRETFDQVRELIESKGQFCEL